MSPENPIEPNQPPIPEVPMVPPVPKTNWIIPILFLIIGILIGVGGFLAYQKYFTLPKVQPTASSPSSTPDVTANWKTYTNTDYGFSFKYPGKWKIEEQFGADMISKFTTSKKPLMLFVKNETGGDVIYIDPELPLGYGKVTSTGTKSIAGVTVNYWNYGQSTTHYTNFQLANLPNFSIDVYKSSIEIDQILSTFKFLGQDQMTEEEQVRSFSEEFAKTYASSNWTKLKTMLTKAADQDITQNKINLSPEGVPVYSGSSVVSVTKNASGYNVELEFLLNGQPFKKVAGNPVIKVVKENGEWKSMTWYLFQ